MNMEQARASMAAKMPDAKKMHTHAKKVALLALASVASGKISENEALHALGDAVALVAAAACHAHGQASTSDDAREVAEQLAGNIEKAMLEFLGRIEDSPELWDELANASADAGASYAAVGEMMQETEAKQTAAGIMADLQRRHGGRSH